MIASTYDSAEPVAWRQWHHWNVARGLGHIHMERGLNVITVKTISQGQMNYASLQFNRMLPK